MDGHLTYLEYAGQSRPVTFVETTSVQDGVICDVYTFDNDTSRDLGVVTIQPGFRSPRQRILKGIKTIQRFVSGTAYLYVDELNGDEHARFFDIQENPQDTDVEVLVGEIMQWSSLGPDPLIYHEICEPPYEDGRFENLTN